MTPSTAAIWDPRYLLHDTGLWHPERPERLQAIKKVLDKFTSPERGVEGEARSGFAGRGGDASPLLTRLEPRMATPEEISLVHDSEYVKKIEETAGHDIQLDPDTPVSPKSWEAACLAVGGMLTAVDWILEGVGTGGATGGGPPPDRSEARTAGGYGSDRTRSHNAFAFVRPPGHHAERARAMGFCLFNNVAIAAEYALRKPGIGKVLIVDYDVHHGNGTQSAFYDRNDVFYISTHRYPFYPGTGARKEEGTGKGKGFTLNVPFSGGQGDEEYLKAFDDEIIPAARDFGPDLILISAGYDAHRLDPLGGMNVTSKGFAEMTRRILEIADQSCSGKVLCVLEGGYSLEGLAESVEECLKAMTDYSLFKS